MYLKIHLLFILTYKIILHVFLYCQHFISQHFLNFFSETSQTLVVILLHHFKLIVNYFLILKIKQKLTECFLNFRTKTQDKFNLVRFLNVFSHFHFREMLRNEQTVLIVFFVVDIIYENHQIFRIVKLMNDGNSKRSKRLKNGIVLFVDELIQYSSLIIEIIILRVIF